MSEWWKYCTESAEESFPASEFGPVSLDNYNPNFCIPTHHDTIG